MTPDEVRQKLRSQGKTLTDFANEHGYRRDAVYRVMSGKDKAWYGRAHEIATKLGLKNPEPEERAA